MPIMIRHSSTSSNVEALMSQPSITVKPSASPIPLGTTLPTTGWPPSVESPLSIPELHPCRLLLARVEFMLFHPYKLTDAMRYRNYIYPSKSLNLTKKNGKLGLPHTIAGTFFKSKTRYLNDSSVPLSLRILII